MICLKFKKIKNLKYKKIKHLKFKISIIMENTSFFSFILTNLESLKYFSFLGLSFLFVKKQILILLIIAF